MSCRLALPDKDLRDQIKPSNTTLACEVILDDSEFVALFLTWAAHIVTLSGALREDQFRELGVQVWNR